MNKRQEIVVRPQHGQGQLSSVFFTVSFELEQALKMLIADIPGVVGLYLLENNECPKLFVITRDSDLDRDHTIVQRMMQIEDIKPGTDLNYDLVPEDRIHFIPSDARALI